MVDHESSRVVVVAFFTNCPLTDFGIPAATFFEQLQYSVERGPVCHDINQTGYFLADQVFMVTISSYPQNSPQKLWNG